MLSRIPFASVHTIGTDIVHVKRIEALILKASLSHMGRNQLRFLDRILHPLERRDFNQRFPKFNDCTDGANDVRDGHGNVAKWIAGRWAAKEAAKKAWGAKKLGFKDVRVEVCKDGEVQMVCRGRTILLDGQTKEAEQVARLSISHDADYAIATVLATPLQLLPADAEDGKLPNLLP